MSTEQSAIFLGRVMARVDKGEFDKKMEIPFASRKLLKAVIQSKIDKKLETGATPILSENNLEECIEDVREAAVFTAALFLEVGILQENEKGSITKYEVTQQWNNLLNPK